MNEVKRIILGDGAYIDVHSANAPAPTPAILVIPGGGYGIVCSDREGAPIAEAFVRHGYTAFVLNYRTGEGHHYPEQLIDAARAMAYIRTNCVKLGVSPERVFAVGFSAGGHLVGSLSTGHKMAEELLGLPENFTRPTGSIYAYPVSSTVCATHVASFKNLLGKPVSDFTEEEIGIHSIDLAVTSDAPPAFIWHTAEDEVVPVYGSLRLAEAYIKAGVPLSLHIYPYGTHGVALGNEETLSGNERWLQPLAAGWVDYAVEFMKTV